MYDNVRRLQWGDAVYKEAAAVGGLDVFVFAPNNRQDVMYDLEQGKDHIDLAPIKELDFAHLGISYLDAPILMITYLVRMRQSLTLVVETPSRPWVLMLPIL